MIGEAFEEAEKVRTDYYTNKYKNQLLLPIFRELKIAIRNNLHHKEILLGDMFEQVAVRIANKYNRGTKQYKEAIDSLKQQFKAALVDLRLNQELQVSKIKPFEEQIKSIKLRRLIAYSGSVG